MNDRRPLSQTRRAGTRLGVSTLLVVLLAVPIGAALPANANATLVQPASTGKAKTARQALLKPRTNLVTVNKTHPGKTVGGARTPLPRTIVTKRILPN
jgi:hypothetical protein